MDDLKQLVEQKYSQIAMESSPKKETVDGCCSDSSHVAFSENYDGLDGYLPEADLGLGCGMPTKFAMIRKGDTVVDLGSGAGNDCFIARAHTGEEGRVIGVDMTRAMIEKARANAHKLGFDNVQFRKGDIENMPVANNIADVVISNCVLNLVPNKYFAFAEIWRILRPGGQFSISDMVREGEFPEDIMNAAMLFTGCVCGAMNREEYIDLIEKSGFHNVEIRHEKTIELPDELLKEYLSEEQLKEFKFKGARLTSITVTGQKPVCLSCSC